jgi:hypothetical protein
MRQRAIEEGAKREELVVRLNARLVLRGVIALLVVGVSLYWLTLPPARPGSVPANAVFLKGPHSTPFAKQGYWVNCWLDSKGNTDVCRFMYPDGRPAFEGAFLPNQGQAPVQDSDLVISEDALNSQNPFRTSVWVGTFFVEMLPLKNGQVLIPKDAYAEGQERLKSSNDGRSP